jgi:hypothetical protein
MDNEGAGNNTGGHSCTTCSGEITRKNMLVKK